MMVKPIISLSRVESPMIYFRKNASFHPLFSSLGVKQKYTQSSGRRPFGISCLLTGFDYDGTPHLYQTDPAGIYSEWKANAIGRSAKTVREFLEKNYNAEVAAKEDDTIKLAIKALLEVVQQGGKNLEVAVMRRGKKMEMLSVATIDEHVKVIEKEKEEEAAKQKRERGSGAAAQDS